MNKIFLFLLLFSSQAFGQMKTLIPLEEEVGLPTDSLQNINLSTSFAETQIARDSLISFFSSELKKTINSSRFHFVDSSKNHLEIFIIYPCKSFNLVNIQSHQIVKEGIITSSLYIDFDSTEYTVTVKDFEWVNIKKHKTNLSKIYQHYLKSYDLKEKLKFYGILKSAEFSIAEVFSDVTVVINEIIKRKSEN